MISTKCYDHFMFWGHYIIRKHWNLVILLFEDIVFWEHYDKKLTVCIVTVTEVPVLDRGGAPASPAPWAHGPAEGGAAGSDQCPRPRCPDLCPVCRPRRRGPRVAAAPRARVPGPQRRAGQPGQSTAAGAASATSRPAARYHRRGRLPAPAGTCHNFFYISLVNDVFSFRTDTTFVLDQFSI